MTSPYQFVFDNMETFSINREPQVGQTISRDRTVRSVVRGNLPWVFTVKLPDGLSWKENHAAIKAMDEASTFTSGTVSLSAPGYADWLEITPEFHGKTWTVICVQKPKWTIFQRNLISWDGEFVFVEVTS